MVDVEQRLMATPKVSVWPSVSQCLLVKDVHVGSTTCMVSRTIKTVVK